MANVLLDYHILGLLTTGMSDRQLRAVGEIATLWNSIEHRFQVLIWKLGNWDDKIGSFITADLGNVSRQNLAKNLVASLPRQDNSAKELMANYVLATIDLFGEIRITRNDVVHGLPIIESGSSTAHRAKKTTATPGKGELKIMHYDISIEALETCISQLTQLILSIEECVSQLWLIELEEEEPDARGLLARRTPLIDISKIRELVGLLRSERQSGHKRQLQPRSSSE